MRKWTVWFDFVSERCRSGGCSPPFGGGVKITWSKRIMKTGMDMLQCYRQRHEACWHARSGGARKSIADGSVSFEMPLSGDGLVKLTTLGGCTCQWVVSGTLGAKNLTEVTKFVVWLSRISVSALHFCRGRNLLTTRHAKKKKPMSRKHPPSTPTNKFKTAGVGKE